MKINVEVNEIGLGSHDDTETAIFASQGSRGISGTGNSSPIITPQNVIQKLHETFNMR